MLSSNLSFTSNLGYALVKIHYKRGGEGDGGGGGGGGGAATHVTGRCRKK